MFVSVGICFCGLPNVWVQYRDDSSEIIKKAYISDISGTPYFRTKGRKFEINVKQLHHIDIFSDTVEIYHSDTWCRTDIYPITKDTVPLIYHGWMKISTTLSGIANFGKLSASLSELKQINFKPKEILAKAAQASDTTAAALPGTEEIQQSAEPANEGEDAQ